MEREEVEEHTEDKNVQSKIANVDLVTLLQMGINHLCKNNLKKGELIVLGTLVNNQIIVWVYPHDADLKMAESLLATGIVQVKNMSIAREKKNEESRIKELTSKYVA
jgi:hypothetical protein